MTQRSAGTARQNCCHSPTPGRQCGVADGVDANMDAMQFAKGHPILDCAGPKAKRQELPPRDDTVLADREFRDLTGTLLT